MPKKTGNGLQTGAPKEANEERNLGNRERKQKRQTSHQENRVQQARQEG
jgi:hypothetical protein